MRIKPLVIGTLIAVGLVLVSGVLARQTSLTAATIRCYRYGGTAREQCLKQGSPSLRGNNASFGQENPSPRRRMASSAAPVSGDSYAINNADFRLPAVSDGEHVRGNPQARVTLIEYVDFECPFCKKHVGTADQLIAMYGNDVSVVFRHFPLPFHQNAFKEAEAAECAGRFGGNDGFWKYHDALFARTKGGGTGFSADQLVPLAAELGIPSAGFSSCLDNGEAGGVVTAQFDAGKKAGVTATPTMFIVNRATGQAEKILGAVSVERYKGIIDGMLGR